MFNNEYLNGNKIPELFEALTDSLLLNQPDDCVQHLKESLDRIKGVGLEEYKYENFHSNKDQVLKKKLVKGLFKCPEDSKLNDGDKVDDYRVLLLISSPGEMKPLGGKLSQIYSNCGYINVGKCLRRRIKEESQKGISRWKVSKSLLNNGDFVPEDIVLNVLLDEMKKLSTKALIIIEGYPKNIKQVQDFDNAIGLHRILKVCAVDSYESLSTNVLLDAYEFRSDEPDFRPYGVARKMAYYKAFTLPVLKYFQDMKKLEMVQLSNNNFQMVKQITELLAKEIPDIILRTKISITSPDQVLAKILETRDKILNEQILYNYSNSPLICNSAQLYSIPEPAKRRYDLRMTPLILLNGPPKCGKTTLGRNLIKLFPGWYHYDCATIQPFSMTMCDEKTIINNCCKFYNDLETISSFAVGIFMENFPTSEPELRKFNEKIGNIDLQIFIDVSNYNISMRYLRNRDIIPDINDNNDLSRQSSAVVDDLLKHYQYSILPTIRYFNDRSISFNINGNQSIENITSQVSDVIKSIFY